MNLSFKPGARVLGAAGLALAGLMAWPLESMGQSVEADAQTVVRDAATGQLRAPTAAEAKALQSKIEAQRKGRPEQRLLPRVSSSGARGVRLTDATLSYTVLVRQSDGTLQEVCFDSKEAAESYAKTGHVAQATTLVTE